MCIYTCYIYIHIFIYKYIHIYIYIYFFICVVLNRACVQHMGMWAGTVRTLPTQCPHSARTVPATVSFWEPSSIWSFSINEEMNFHIQYSCVLSEVQILDDSQVGAVAGTVWALCGHCVGIV